MWAVLVTKVFYQRVISYVLFGNRDFKIQDATDLRKRWPGKSLERGRRCKRGKFMLRFATRLGQYQYINPYKGFQRSGSTDPPKENGRKFAATAPIASKFRLGNTR